MDSPGRSVEAAILQKAAELFWSKGYHATSMQDLAAAVGLHKASLYHYFPSKEAILLRINSAIQAELFPPIAAIVESAAPAEEKLRRAITHHVRTVAAYQGPMSVLLFEYRGLSPGTLHDLLPARRVYAGFFERIVQQGLEGGVFHTSEPTVATYAILGMCNWLTLWYRRDGRLSPEAIADELVALALRGLGGRQGE